MLAVLSRSPTHILKLQQAGQSALFWANTKGSVEVAARLVAAGAKAQGILLNAPVADAVAIVRVFGVTQAYAGDTIADGAYVAVEVTNGRMKTAVAATVAGGAGDPSNDAVVGSHVLGFALSDGTAGNLFRMFVNPMGAIPTTAA